MLKNLAASFTAIFSRSKAILDLTSSFVHSFWCSVT